MKPLSAYSHICAVPDKNKKLAGKGAVKPALTSFTFDSEDALDARPELLVCPTCKRTIRKGTPVTHVELSDETASTNEKE